MQVYAWEPELYADNSSLPSKDKKNFMEGYMTVTCEGEVCNDKALQKKLLSFCLEVVYEVTCLSLVE